MKKLTALLLALAILLSLAVVGASATEALTEEVLTEQALAPVEEQGEALFGGKLTLKTVVNIPDVIDLPITFVIDGDNRRAAIATSLDVIFDSMYGGEFEASRMEAWLLRLVRFLLGSKLQVTIISNQVLLLFPERRFGFRVSLRESDLLDQLFGLFSTELPEFAWSVFFRAITEEYGSLNRFQLEEDAEFNVLERFSSIDEKVFNTKWMIKIPIDRLFR